jgi:hypothetical protein
MWLLGTDDRLTALRKNRWFIRRGRFCERQGVTIPHVFARGAETHHFMKVRVRHDRLRQVTLRAGDVDDAMSA